MTKTTVSERQQREALAVLGQLDAKGRRQWLLDGRDLIALRKAQAEGWMHDARLSDEENRRRSELSKKKFPWSAPGI